MSEVVVDIRNLSKRYLLSHQHRPDSIKTWLREMALCVLDKSAVAKPEEFWALHNVSLQLAKGECLALVGRNGSGKSTLLKILSRVIPPTDGEIRARGRVASLLEVGTGFHPELTGRENVFLNGAMLGCPAQEIRRQFDTIVNFSGIERFLDTPVKHYSSGMYVRLAYSIAASIDADILILDEILAVGDTEFQQKCIGNLELLKQQEKCIIFVSHNESLVRRLATHVAELDQGRLIGPARSAREHFAAKALATTDVTS